MPLGELHGADGGLVLGVVIGVPACCGFERVRVEVGVELVVESPFEVLDVRGEVVCVSSYAIQHTVGHHTGGMPFRISRRSLHRQACPSATLVLVTATTIPVDSAGLIDATCTLPSSHQRSLARRDAEVVAIFADVPDRHRQDVATGQDEPSHPALRSARDPNRAMRH